MRKKYKEYFPINDSKKLKTTTYQNLDSVEKKKWQTSFRFLNQNLFLTS